MAEEDRIVGFISMAHKGEDPHTLELTAPYVTPGWFGRGLGTRLHNDFVRERRRDETARRDVWVANEPPSSFTWYGPVPFANVAVIVPPVAQVAAAEVSDSVG